MVQLDGENRREDQDPTGSGILELIFREWKQQSVCHRPDSTNSPPIVRQPEGFGGWLIFPAFNTLIAPLAQALIAFNFLQMTRATWFPTSPSSSKGLILFNLTASAVLTVGWSFVLVAMVRKKRWYPRAFAILAAASVACHGFLPGLPFQQWAIALFSYIIWTVYLFKSVSVKNTFVRDTAGVIARVFD
jgi:hypothetical protein